MTFRVVSRHCVCFVSLRLFRAVSCVACRLVSFRADFVQIRFVGRFSADFVSFHYFGIVSFVSFGSYRRR